MPEPTYREALAASWRLAWRHKAVWIFGLFAMALGQFGLVDFLVKVSLAQARGGLGEFWSWCRWLLSLRAWNALSGGLSGLPSEAWVWLIWLTVVMAGLALTLLFVAVVSQGAIVYAAAKYAKRLAVFPDDRTAWHHSVRHFWRLIGLNVLRKLVMVLAALAVVGAGRYFYANPSSATQVLTAVVFMLATLVGLVLSLLLIYAVGYVVVEEYSFGKALQSAWKLFFDHWLVSIEVGIILLAANFVFILIALIGVVYVFFVPILAAKWFARLFGSYEILRAGVVFGYGLFVVYMMLLGSVFTVFTTSVWTYLFTKMHKEGVVSRMVHWLRRGRR